MLDVGDEVGEELDAGPQLVVAPESGMERALIVNEAGVELGQTPLGDRRPREVLQYGRERGVVARGDGPLGVDREAGVLPGAQQVGAVVVDGAATEECVEDGVAEGELEDAESGGGLVGGDGMEDTTAIEDPARDEGVDVRVEGQQGAETLRRRDERRDGTVEVGERCRREPSREVVAHDGVGGAAEEAGEAAVEEEGGAQPLGDREDEGEVGEEGLGEARDRGGIAIEVVVLALVPPRRRQHLLDEAQRPLGRAPLAARGTEPARLAREREQPLVLALLAAQPKEPEVLIAAAHEALEEVEHARGEGPELAGEALVVHEAQLVEVGLDEGVPSVVFAERGR